VLICGEFHIDYVVGNALVRGGLCNDSTCFKSALFDWCL
jgi:hypothetical protein